jgi:hypothetical protein
MSLARVEVGKNTRNAVGKSMGTVLLLPPADRIGLVIERSFKNRGYKNGFTLYEEDAGSTTG